MKRTITGIIPLSLVYRQSRWHWYWEAWYQPNIRPGWCMRVQIADHEGEDPSEYWQNASDCAQNIKSLDLKIDGIRNMHDKWITYGISGEYPYLHCIGELDWLALNAAEGGSERNSGLVSGANSA
jgi:hypothetical protein